MPNPTIPADGEALPAEGHKTRRAALGLLAGASALAVMPGTATAGGRDADAELFDLIRIWQEKAALTAVASRAHDETDERQHSGPRPAALVRTDADAKLCLCDAAKVGDSYNLSEIEGFRHGPLSRYDYRRLIKPDGTPSDDAHILERVILSPAAQVRGQEIVAAYDEWVVALEAAKKASGSAAAEEAFLRAVDIEDAALWDVTATPANTLAGVVAKARAADRHLRKGREPTLESMLEDGHFDICGPVDLLLVSIAHDLARLSAGGARA